MLSCVVSCVLDGFFQNAGSVETAVSGSEFKPPCSGFSDMILINTFSRTLLMDDSRDMPLWLDGSRRSLSWPLEIGITWLCKKDVGMCPVASRALKMMVKCKMRESPKMQVLGLNLIWARCFGGGKLPNGLGYFTWRHCDLFIRWDGE